LRLFQLRTEQAAGRVLRKEQSTWEVASSEFHIGEVATWENTHGQLLLFKASSLKKELDR